MRTFLQYSRGFSKRRRFHYQLCIAIFRSGSGNTATDDVISVVSDPLAVICTQTVQLHSLDRSMA